jgi:hypothetical protein
MRVPARFFSRVKRKNPNFFGLKKKLPARSIRIFKNIPEQPENSRRSQKR